MTPNEHDEEYVIIDRAHPNDPRPYVTSEDIHESRWARVGSPEPVTAARRRGWYRSKTWPLSAPDGLSANALAWRAALSTAVLEYRAHHQGQSPSFRAAALAASGGDAGMVDTWRSRVRRNALVVDPALGWPQGDAVANSAVRSVK
jgi:hypothetical protein